MSKPTAGVRLDLAGAESGSAATSKRENRPNLATERSNHIASIIVEKILRGEMHPGDKVDQDALSAELGVSRVPIREALIRVESGGFVTKIARRGWCVSAITQDDIHDHYELIAFASGMAARRASYALSEDDLVYLRSLLARLSSARDPVELAELNFLFHRTINNAGATLRLKAHLRTLIQSIPTGLFTLPSGYGKAARTQHAELMRALEEHAPDAAAEAAYHHVRDAGRYAVKLLSDAGFWDPQRAGTSRSSPQPTRGAPETR